MKHLKALGIIFGVCAAIVVLPAGALGMMGAKGEFFQGCAVADVILILSYFYYILLKEQSKSKTEK